MALPAISEDDENQSEGETSPWTSPLHAALAKSPKLPPQPRHKRILRRGTTLSSLRERIVRQPVAICNSLEDLSNEEDGGDKETDETTGDKKDIKKSVERLDTEVITLHQNVTALSIEVRLFFISHKIQCLTTRNVRFVTLSRRYKTLPFPHSNQP